MYSEGWEVEGGSGKLGRMRTDGVVRRMGDIGRYRMAVSRI